MYVKYEKVRTHVLHKCPSKVPRRRLLGPTTKSEEADVEVFPYHTLLTAGHAIACPFHFRLPLLNLCQYSICLLFHMQIHADFGFLQMDQLIDFLVHIG